MSRSAPAIRAARNANEVSRRRLFEHQAQETERGSNDDTCEFAIVQLMTFLALEKNRRRDVHENANDNRHQFRRMPREKFHIAADQQPKRRHHGEDSKTPQRDRALESAVQEHSEQRNRDRIIVDDNAPEKQPPRLRIVITVRAAQRHRLDERVDAQTDKNAEGKSVLGGVGVAMFDTLRRPFKRNLNVKSYEDQHPDDPRFRVGRFIKFRQQVQERQAQQISADEGVERLEMARLIQLEPENTACAQNNAGKKYDVVHNS